MIEPGWLITLQLLSPLIAVAIAWGAFKSTLNGTVKRVERIESKIDTLVGEESALCSDTESLKVELITVVSRLDRVQVTVNDILRQHSSISTRVAHLEGACPLYKCKEE